MVKGQSRREATILSRPCISRAGGQVPIYKSNKIMYAALRNIFDRLSISRGYIHETHLNIVNMYRILEPIAESLIRHNRLRPDDNWDAISTELARYL
jgi:hypothetical protein